MKSKAPDAFRPDARSRPVNSPTARLLPSHRPSRVEETHQSYPARQESLCSSLDQKPMVAPYHPSVLVEEVLQQHAEQKRELPDAGWDLASTSSERPSSSCRRPTGSLES